MLFSGKSKVCSFNAQTGVIRDDVSWALESLAERRTNDAIIRNSWI